MDTIFCTYGDSKFSSSRVRLCKEAEATGLFDRCITYTEATKNDSEFRNALENPAFRSAATADRGSGYWLWKPYILYKTLANLNEGDILIYSDAGSTFPNSQECVASTKRLINRIRDSELGVLGCRNPFIEADWTKGDVFHYFGAFDNQAITHSRQFSAGRLHLAKKCRHSLLLYSSWWKTACEQPTLFDDTPSRKPNLPGFKENRHDASVWSLLCKCHGVIEEWNWDSIPLLATRIRC